MEHEAKKLHDLKSISTLNSNSQSPFRMNPFASMQSPSHDFDIMSSSLGKNMFSQSMRQNSNILKTLQKEEALRKNSLMSEGRQLPPINTNQDQELKMKRKQMIDQLGNSLEGANQKKSILLKKQMSETRFQEYKRQQMQQMTEELLSETVDNFFSPQRARDKLSKKKNFKTDNEGHIPNRCILGTPEVFMSTQSKNTQQTQMKKINLQPQPTLQGIMVNRGSAISTPQSRIMKQTRSSADLSGFASHGFASHTQVEKQQQKGVNFQISKAPQKPSLSINNTQIDLLKKRLEERIKQNEIREEDMVKQSLPPNVLMRESQSLRILNHYNQTIDYWDKQKVRFSQQAGKAQPEKSVMQRTDDIRRKYEAQDLVDKSMINVQFMGVSLWKANLRIYHEESNYMTQSQIFKSQSQHQTQDMIRKDAYLKQRKLEEKESSKTFLASDAISQCVDVGSLYMDRSFKPTEIVRTPNFDLAKQIHDMTSSSYLKLENSTEQPHGHLYQHPWWNETLKEEIIHEENNEDDPLTKTNDSINQNFAQPSINNTQQLLPKMRSVSTTVPVQMKNSTTSSFPYQSQMGYSSFSAMSRRKRNQQEMFDQTLQKIKEKHAHLIANTNEDDLSVLCIQGVKKLDIEVEGAKRILGQKVLLDQNAINGDDEDATKEKDELIAFNYDQKVFY